MIALVHLVWGPLGPEPLRRFLAAYRAHPSGVEHELLVLLNGVDAAQRPVLLAELEGTEHRPLELERPVQDLVAYFQALARIEHERVCFVNSFSEPLAPGWLAKLSQALDEPGAGLAGASGSWASLRSLALYLLRIPGPYRRALPDRSAFFAHFGALQGELGGSPGPPAPSPGGRLRDTLAQLAGFPAFPDAHLRTNAWIAERRVLERVRTGELHTKMGAYRLESGRASITRQLERMGLRALVVDRDGIAHEPRRWPDSATFWQGRQERLLVADNQTGAYARGGAERRAILAALAWGRAGIG